MICIKCNKRSICKIYDMTINNSSMIDISINTCNYNNDKAEVVNVVNNNTISTHNTIGKFRREGVDMDKLNMLSKMTEENKPKVEEPKPKMTFSAEIPSSDDKYIKCPTCEATTVSDDLKLCECGAIICSACATVDSDTKMNLCSECWEKI